MTRRARVGNLKVWAALLVATLSAAIVVAIIGVVLDAGTAVAATASRATIEATDQFSVSTGETGEAFAVCPGTKRALGGGIVQSGPAQRYFFLNVSGPLDNTGVTANTKDGDIAKQWYAAVENRTGASVKFKVFAICSGSSNATIEATPFTVEPDPNGNGKFAEGYAKCPGTKRALGGGVVQSGSPDKNLLVQASGPLDATGFTSETVTGDIAKQWYAAVGNYWVEQTPLKVMAICE